MNVRDELKANVEELAIAEGKDVITIISELQTGAAIANENDLLELLCDIKWDYFKC